MKNIFENSNNLLEPRDSATPIWSYTISANNAIITGVSPEPYGLLEIPNKITVRTADKTNTYTVTAISSEAFKNCTEITSITFPNTLIDIGASAFFGCAGLVSLNIPSTINTIKPYTFYECSSLISIDIPSELTAINYYGFWHCNDEVTVNIHDIDKWCNISLNSQYSTPMSRGNAKLRLNNNELTGNIELNPRDIIAAYTFHYNILSDRTDKTERKRIIEAALA